MAQREAEPPPTRLHNLGRPQVAAFSRFMDTLLLLVIRTLTG